MEFGEPDPDSNTEFVREIRTIHASFLHSRIAVRIPGKPTKIDPFSAYPAPADRVDALNSKGFCAGGSLNRPELLSCDHRGRGAAGQLDLSDASAQRHRHAGR